MPYRALPHAVLTCACCMLAASATHAQSVAMTGVMGSQALLVINGSAPKALRVNETHQGVRVVHVQGQSATIELQGQRQTLHVGGSPVSMGQGLESNRKVILRADGRGYFKGHGFINRQPMHYLVDTGANVIGIGLSDAQRMGLDFKNGPSVTIGTANGSAQGWRVKLDSVRIGDITVYGMDAVVSPQPMPYVLLGNNFLAQLHMKRQGNEMVLQLR